MSFESIGLHMQGTYLANLSSLPGPKSAITDHVLLCPAISFARPSQVVLQVEQGHRRPIKPQSIQLLSPVGQIHTLEIDHPSPAPAIFPGLIACCSAVFGLRQGFKKAQEAGPLARKAPANDLK